MGYLKAMTTKVMGKTERVKMGTQVVQMMANLMVTENWMKEVKGKALVADTMMGIRTAMLARTRKEID